MKQQVLESLGLSKNESSIYLSLIELGSSRATEIAKHCKVHRTNVYDALRGLIKKGVVAHITKNGTKYYEAADPENLYSILKEKEFALQKIIPELKLSKQMAKKENEVNIYDGIKAIKDLLNHFTEKGVDRCVYGAPANASEKIGKGWLAEYHKKRIKKKVFLRHIYNDEAMERIKHLNTLPYTETRFLPKQFNTPVATEVCGDEVVLMLWDEKEPTAIQIKNSRVAKAYQNYFDFMWKFAKKP